MIESLPLKNKRPTWDPFEQKIYKTLRESEIPNRNLLIAVSGGLDSVALMECLSRLAKGLNLKVRVVHVHHGPHKNKKQNAFRIKAFNFVRQISTLRNLEFRGEIRKETVKDSEAHLREFRRKLIFSIKKENESVALAHHRDDLLETRLTRLIRGVGPEGLNSMSLDDGTIIRPFLGISRAEILKYAKGRKLKWLEDPSNQNSDPLRNWVRKKWLPQLEKKQPGASQGLHRSLENLLAKEDLHWVEEHFNERGILRQSLLALSPFRRRQVLASFLKRKGVKNYSLAHIDEVLKRVSAPQKQLTFRVMNRVWTINAEYIEIP